MNNALRADIPLLAAGGQCPHYLDNAATALMPRAVLEATQRYDAENRGNIGRGLHPFAEAADAAYQSARQTVAESLSVAPDEIVFTAGNTAALNMLAIALGDSLTAADSILLSIAEHHSNIVPWQIMARRRGFKINFCGINDDGVIDPTDAVTAIEQQRPRIVALTHTSNVSGGINDFSAIAAATNAVGARLLIDGAQFVPHDLPDMTTLGADFYVFSGHKCYAPNGIGVLWGRGEALAELPLVVGGGGTIERVTTDDFTAAAIPQRLEAGTPPITQAVGLAHSFIWRRQWPATTTTDVLRLAKKMRQGLAQIPAARLLFANDSAIVSFLLDGIHPHDVCEWLAMRGVAVRGGHHCAQPLMTHLGINGCVRASIAPYNNDEDIDSLLNGVEEAARRLR